MGKLERVRAMAASGTVTLAIQRFDRTAALHTGKVAIPNVTALYAPAGTAVAGLMAGVFDAAELPLAHYAFLRDRGEPFTAIPVFPDRLFLHQYVYTLAGRGISSPNELRGRRVAVPQYFMTSSIWHRGLLKGEYGIRPEEIEWHTTAAERDPRMALPRGVRVLMNPGPHWGADPLLQGAADCLMHEGTPVVPSGQKERLVRLYPDVHERQKEFYRKTGSHIIVHVIAVRGDVMAGRPALGEELCTAFDRAKQRAYDLLQNERMTSLPLMRSYLDETVATFGEDPWSYGFQQNRPELDCFLGYAWEQGLTQKRLSPEDLFDGPYRDFPFEAKMNPYGIVPGSVTQF